MQLPSCRVITLDQAEFEEEMKATFVEFGALDALDDWGQGY